jgi:acyl-coenzyme A synthetase/AMP-(fatty) acid ligase
MLTTYEWLSQKSKEFSDKTYLLDANREVTYLENFETIQSLMTRLSKIGPQDQVVFLGAGSIESYQLYFAIIALQAIWIPINFHYELETIEIVLDKLNPILIIYDNEAKHLIQKLNSSYKAQSIAGLFNDLNESILSNVEETRSNRIISMYLTSGSTGLPKIVKHSWEATLQHANATVERYGFKSSSRLFNPRQLFHVSGAFALTTLMHCGGSIVIPRSDYYKTSEQEYLTDWAFLIQQKEVTHISFFPAEMRAYAELIDNIPLLTPKSLQRITTGGEGVELSDLINIGRVFATNRMWFDFLWKLYPYIGDNNAFMLLKRFYEKIYGPMVQVTQTYGATELICNAVANTTLSGPDTRGVGSALCSIHPEIVDNDGFLLPHDGKVIGRLRFFGSSIASGYLDDDEETLSPYHYETKDLAAIDPSGRITFFGRSENLIRLPGIENAINPVLLEREICQLSNVKLSVVFKLEKQLHAAVLTDKKINQYNLIAELKSEMKLSLVSTVSIWEKFPLTEGGKTDRKSIFNAVDNSEVTVIEVGDSEQEFSYTFKGICLIC